MTLEYDPDWWKAKKAASLARRREQRISVSGARTGDSVLIVTEGTVTEPTYFTLLRDGLRLSTLTIKIMPGLHSDPRHVVRTAKAEMDDLARRAKQGTLAMNEPRTYNHVWAVVDTDVAVRQGFWTEVVQLAQASGVKLAGSSPCFEYWLLLHLTYTTRTDLVDGDAAKEALKTTCRETLDSDYSTKKDVAVAALKELLMKWPTAVIRADQVRRMHQAGGTPPPANPSTDVDLLVSILNDTAMPHHQKRAHLE